MKYGHFDFKFGRYLRVLPVLLAILLFASISSAATVCVDGDTLAQYIATHSCYVNAGLGVQVLFSFDSTAFAYLTDSAADPDSLGLTAAQFRVYGVTGPGNPEAGLRFQSGAFTVPLDASFADVNLTFGVSLYTLPLGVNWKFNSAHLSLDDTLGPDGFLYAAETDTLGAGFNLQLSNPPSLDDVPDQTYGPQLGLKPNIDLFVAMPGSKINSWTESFDMLNTPEPGTLALIPGALILLGLFRNRRAAKSILPALALLTVLAAKSHAVAVCTDLTAINGAPVGAGTSLTIDKYIAYSSSFGGCMMNDMLFNITSFTTTGTAFTTPTAANTKLNFNVADLPGGINTVQMSYLPVATTTASPAGQNLTITFQYSVTAPTYRVTKMIGSTSVAGAVTRTTTIVPNTAPAVGTVPGGLNPSVNLSNPLGTTYTVTDTFNLAGAAKHISSATDTFTEVVPEPVTSLLMGGSLLGLGVLFRRRRA